MKTIEQQIAVMQHFLNGGEVEEYFENNICFGADKWVVQLRPTWDWHSLVYRIKEKKQTVTIEKWLCEYEGCNELRGSKRFFIIEKAVPFDIAGKKIKLIDSYEVDIDSTEK